MSGVAVLLLGGPHQGKLHHLEADEPRLQVVRRRMAQVGPTVLCDVGWYVRTADRVDGARVYLWGGWEDEQLPEAAL